MNGDVSRSEAEPPSLPRKITLEREAEGYGFNLHGEKGIHGQYISAVDDGSPAQRNDLRVGDRVIGVNNEDVEDLPHSKVVERIRAGGNQVTLLVVDEQCDQFYKSLGVKIPHDRFEAPSNSAPVVAASEDNRIEEPPPQGEAAIPDSVVQTPEMGEDKARNEDGSQAPAANDDDPYEEVIPRREEEEKPAETPAAEVEESSLAPQHNTTITDTSVVSEQVSNDALSKNDMAAARPKPKRNEVKRATQNWKQKYDDFNKL